MVSQHEIHHQVARDTAEAGLIRLIAALAVILPAVALVQTIANSRDYSKPAAAIVVWLAVLGAGAWLVPRLRRGGLTAGETAGAILIAVGAVAATGAAHQAHGAPGGIDLAILGTAWLLILIVISHSARVWVPAALLIFAVQAVLLIRDEGLNSLSLSRLAAAGYIIATVLIAFAALRQTLGMHVGLAARQASLASRSAAERAATAAVQQERQSTLAVLEKEALPLLRGIADGTLDPATKSVRERCDQHAAALRHSLTGGVRGGGELTAALEPILRASAARELPVTVQLIGDPGTPPPPVTQAALATVDAVLRALPPDQATLTVLASGDDVEIYLTFGAPPYATPDLTRFGVNLPAAVRWHAALHAAETDGGYLEVSWRKDGAA
jgi:hypothetical protein